MRIFDVSVSYQDDFKTMSGTPEAPLNVHNVTITKASTGTRDKLELQVNSGL